MKLKLHLPFPYKLIAIFSLMLLSCSDDNAEPGVTENPDGENVKVTFNVAITAPDKDRDYSYHNNGVHGIYDDPTAVKNFEGKISITSGSYNIDSNTDFVIKWSSNIDGTLHEGNPGATYKSAVSANLSKALHVIKFEAYLTGHPETVVKDSIVVSNIIKLKGESLGNSVKLQWDKYEGEGFISYLIYKENFQPIAEIADVNQIEYIDSDITDLIYKNKYQIVVNTQDNTTVLGSTFVECSAAKYLELEGFTTKVMKSPINNKVYAILSNGRSGGNENFGIIVINPETLEIENHILKDQIFTDFDISYDGQTMYLTQKGINYITIVNLNTLNSTTIHSGTGNWGYHKIEVTESDYLICHQQPPTSGSSPIKLVNKNDGSTYTSLQHLHGDIEYNVKNSKLYAGESNISNGYLRMTTLADGQLQQWGANHFPEDTSFGESYPQPYLFLSDDRDYIFWENYQLDLEMNIIRQFNTRMKACSPNNQYLADESKIYNYGSVSEILDFNVVPHSSTDKVHINFIDDHTVITTFAIDNNYTHLPETTYFFKHILP